MDKFRQKKEHTLRKYEDAKSNGFVDTALISFLDDINYKRSDMFTTSSCSGRICLLQDLGSKLQSEFLARWHTEVTVDEVEEALKSVPGIVWFNQEPFILHLVVETEELAKEVLTLAVGSGFKRSGLLHFAPGRYIVEILSTEKIVAPVARDGNRIVDSEYIAFLVDLANERMRRGTEKSEKFRERFSAQFL